MAKIALCIIKVHYQCGNGSFDHHAIVPTDPPRVLNLQLSMQKAETSTSSTLELNKRLRNRGEDRWHSILCGVGSTFSFFVLLNFFCLWIASLKVFPILDESQFHPSVELVTYFFIKVRVWKLQKTSCFPAFLENLFEFGDTMYQNQTKFAILSL